MMISEHAQRTPCNLINNAPIELNGQLHTVDQTTGQVSKIPRPEIKTLKFQNDFIEHIPELSSTIFHHFLLTNLTDAFPSMHAQMGSKMFRIEQSIAQLGEYTRHSSNNDDESSSSFLQTHLFPHLTTPWQLWVTIICFIVTINKLLLPLLRIFCPQVATLLVLVKQMSYRTGAYAFRRVINISTSNSNTNGNASNDTPLVNTPAATPWPPRVTFPADIMTVQTSVSQPCLAGHVNNCRVTLMLDTGSALTVCAAHWARTFGVDIHPCARTKATGISGHPISIVGIADVNFMIAGFNIQAPLYFCDEHHLSHL